MAKSLSPASPPRPAPSRAATREERSGPALSPLQVRYYRRMHRQRVYAVTVSWDNKDERRPPAGAAPVLLRLIMAGAQVVPSEQPLDPTTRDAHATFYVTPLAQGWLRGERLEVLVDGRKVQEMPLSSHVTSQKLTWFLLAMSVLVPWCLLTYFKGPLLEMAKGDGPAQPAMQMPMGKMPMGKMPMGKMPMGKMAKEKMLKMQKPEGQKPDEQKAEAQADVGAEKKRRFRTRGEVLDDQIKQNLPAVPDVLNDNVPMVREYLVEARGFVTKIYDLLLAQSSQRPLAFYAATGLLLLTLISWWVHREKRKRCIGMPIPLPAGATVPLVAEG